MNEEQLRYLQSLARKQVEDARGVNDSDLKNKEEVNELLQRLNIGEGLTQEQLDQINQIAGLDGTAFLRRGKKLFKANMAENSEEFKQLGNLHKDQRQADYYPQDDSRHFGSKPRGFTK